MSKKDLLIKGSATTIFLLAMLLIFGKHVSATSAEFMECDSSSATSSTYQQSDWDLSFIRTQEVNEPRHYSSINQFIDLNGDGLVDYVNAYTKNNKTDYTDGSYTYHGCVFLNTGHGFEQVHACDATIYKNGYGDLEQSFNGDCAG